MGRQIVKVQNFIIQNPGNPSYFDVYGSAGEPCSSHPLPCQLQALSLPGTSVHQKCEEDLWDLSVSGQAKDSQFLYALWNLPVAGRVHNLSVVVFCSEATLTPCKLLTLLGGREKYATKPLLFYFSLVFSDSQIQVTPGASFSPLSLFPSFFCFPVKRETKTQMFNFPKQHQVLL